MKRSLLALATTGALALTACGSSSTSGSDAAAAGGALQVADVLADERRSELAREYQRLGGYRTNLAVPLLRQGESIGVFTLTRQTVRPFTERQVELVTTFADQAALALDRGQAVTDRQELALLSDRERIARDLHDVVIQRLFATGLQLQGVASMASSPEVARRLDETVSTLDDTIKAIRGTIFELQDRRGDSLRASIRTRARVRSMAAGTISTRTSALTGCRSRSALSSTPTVTVWTTVAVAPSMDTGSVAASRSACRSAWRWLER